MVDIIWNKEVDMVVEVEEADGHARRRDRRGNLKMIGGPDHKRRISQGPNESMRWQAIQQRQNQAWETTMHPSVNDVREETRPSAKRY